MGKSKTNPAANSAEDGSDAPITNILEVENVSVQQVSEESSEMRKQSKKSSSSKSMVILHPYGIDPDKAEKDCIVSAANHGISKITSVVLRYAELRCKLVDSTAKLKLAKTRKEKADKTKERAIKGGNIASANLSQANKDFCECREKVNEYKKIKDKEIAEAVKSL